MFILNFNIIIMFKKYTSDTYIILCLDINNDFGQNIKS